MRVSSKNIVKLVAVAFLLVVIILALNKFHDAECVHIDITVKDSAEVKFIGHNEVTDIMHTIDSHIQGYKMDSIDITAIQKALMANPYIRKVSVYKTISGVLKVEVQQRKPMFMVINNNNQSFYVDNDGFIFATNPESHYPCIVVNGFVKESFDFSNGKKYELDFRDKTAKGTIMDLFKIVRFIEADDFWRDQIEQIYVTKLGEYELVPMVGAQILELGNIDDYDRKMFILKQFYFKAMKKVGWNTYNMISVKYRNQIVCTKHDKK